MGKKNTVFNHVVKHMLWNTLLLFYKISFDRMINSPNDIVPLSNASAIKWLGELIIRRHFDPKIDQH